MLYKKIKGIIISQKHLKDLIEKYLQTGSVKNVVSRQNRIAKITNKDMMDLDELIYSNRER